MIYEINRVLNPNKELILQIYFSNPLILILFTSLAVILSFFIHKLLLKYSAGFGMKNHESEGQIRWTNSVKPSVGGVGIFLLFLFGISVGLMSLQSELFADPRFSGLVWASLLGFVIGLMDDVYQISPTQKFTGQILCAVVLYYSGVFIEISSLPIVNFIISVFWVIGIMNSINMLDNMDGISGVTISGILLSMISVMYFTGTITVSYAMLILGVIGGLIGFLSFNWNPAKIYLGDTGTQFLGVFLAGLAMLFLWNIQPNEGFAFFNASQLIIPVMVFVLPIIDTTTVFIRRIWRGQSPFIGGRDHTTHNLAIFGIQESKVPLIFASVNACTLVMVSIISVCMADWNSLCALCGIVYVLSLFLCIQVVYLFNQRRKVKNWTSSKN